MVLKEDSSGENSQDSETQSTEEVESQESGPVMMYSVPMEEDGGVLTPVYDEVINGTLYLHHTTPLRRYIIQGKKTPHYHRDNVNVEVQELDRDEVEESDNRVRDFV